MKKLSRLEHKLEIAKHKKKDEIEHESFLILQLNKLEADELDLSTKQNSISELVKKEAKKHHKGAKEENKIIIDVEDTAVYQRVPSRQKYIIIQPNYFLPPEEKQLDIAQLYSYIGSGVITYSSNGSSDLVKTEILTTTPTPREAGDLLKNVLMDQVLKFGYRMDPGTKERFLIWLKFSEGQVWKGYYENEAQIRTADYSLTAFS